ncbi:MAG: BlaI/MecI/CopY family transcriptional regulator [Alistipes sp.]|nr:BlaI/MecI/CopY family transcriptional regulator [Alistipes sp.]
MRRSKEELTRGEEEVMRHIWNLKEATVNDIIAQMAEPKPKYTTVATFIKLLENKKYVDHFQVGKSFVYIPVIKREKYAKIVLNSVIDNYFEGSISKLVAYYAENEAVSQEELQTICATIEELKNK